MKSGIRGKSGKSGNFPQIPHGKTEAGKAGTTPVGGSRFPLIPQASLVQPKAHPGVRCGSQTPTPAKTQPSHPAG